MATCADIDSLLTTLCTMSINENDTDFTKMFDVVERLRQVLLVLEAGNNPVPAVLNNDVIFKSVFCFLLDADRAVRYLEELGRSAVNGWSTLAEMEPMEFIQKVSLQAVSEDEKTAVIVIFLCSVLRLSVTMFETLNLAREARVRKRGEVPDGGDFEDRISDIQQGLNKALINCVHLEKLMHNRNPAEERAICAEQTRQMFAGFAIVAQLVYDHGDYTVLREVMSLSEAMFQLAHEMPDAVLDLKVDISERFVPQMIRTLFTEDPELSYSVPFRMYRYYMYVKMEQEVSRGEQWRIDQHLTNANHYCADTGMFYHDGRYAFMCWLLYGLSLFDCGQYATAEVILTMKHMKTSTTKLPSSKTAADCIRKCAEYKDTTRKEFLLYFNDTPPATANDSARETTAWHSIYDDPACRRYSPRHIPNYVEICRRLVKSDKNAEDTVRESLVLESVGPLIDLAYQPKKPTKSIRSDNSVNIYGGSVNENLDVQSHTDPTDAKEEVPDIDMMMAVTPSLLGLNVQLNSSASSPRYTYLMNLDTGERMPSFELLVDSLPIALNRVAEFVADVPFTEQYEIISIAIHGPAIATKIKRGGNRDTMLSYDHVPAFWLKTWPDVAREWITRNRQFGWPSSSVIDEIVQNGVLLVAACHANSDDPNNEWRISFTIAERILVDTLSSTQRLAYLYAKLVWMFSLKSSSFLVSYHLKNALLWLCEERSSEFWSGDNLVVCVRDIFGWLRQEISNGHLRNYFIASDDMIPTWVKSTDDLVQSLDHIIDNTFQVWHHH